ncbi:MAG: aminotransferase class V-fold PLP-dependent enzyme [Candidatus Cloacimonadaceae bacterium]|nr:aminotransferase class V-fold PLP-dependent enzyme [Candidatus Cloacimonadaceae bacterium]MDP3115315.1 aminotransferase class V-fold PLP-dependent enzyme [Candidatus Cloacimonadaceae bacterium]
MSTQDLINELDWLRRDVIGRNMPFETPFGTRTLVYADFTASGRALNTIESHVQRILQYYANTHTEDDFTGKTMTRLLHDAEKIIKRHFNASAKNKIIFTESGTTGGITKLQQILGVYWPPATRERVNSFLKSCLERNPGKVLCNQDLHNYIRNHRPIVFVGPYEHHSNEIMWRQTLCDIIELPLNDNDDLDLELLEKTVSDPQYAKRLKIGSFSAASNVSGLLTDVYEVARIMHRHGGLACFDFAACAPYVEIDMNHDGESYFDAIFFSPHKLIGGPGSSGVLIINEDIYPAKLPPTVPAGGTVDYVSPEKEEYIRDIETREKPGTPGIMQAIRTALAIQIKEKAGMKRISEIEHFYYHRFQDAFKGESRISFYGPQEADRKVPIVPFNICHRGKYLHPKFVTRLLNDLFGIQTRAGCSCAGPYGHHLMKIGHNISDYYRCLITVAGYTGIKPGWVRLNLHYAHDVAEVDYLIAGVKFVIEHGHKFLPLYIFDIKTGEWRHLDFVPVNHIEVDIEQAFAAGVFVHEQHQNASELYRQALDEAYKLASGLPEEYPLAVFEKELENLMFFYVSRVENYSYSGEFLL